MKSAEIMVRVFRANLVESQHRGHIAVVDTEGRTIASLGCHEAVVYARSAAKPLQAIPVIESGAPAIYGLNDEEIAILCASHNGEVIHTSTVQSIIRKLGRSADDLTCGIHDPYHQPTSKEMKAENIKPTTLHNNCSGKHSGMLALALATGHSVEHYASPEHPVQQQMLRAVADMSHTPIDQIMLGVDGCGVPVFGLPLNKLAYAFARLGNPAGLESKRSEACRTIIRALRSHPDMIAGKDRFDTQLIEATEGGVIGKMGAEGVFALTVPDHSIGIAVKVEDGSFRGLYPAVLEALRQLKLVTPAQLERMNAFYRPEVLNHSKSIVGHIEPEFTLHMTS